jgi:hypothetical protein
MDREADSAAPHKGHPKMFPPTFDLADPRTPWQKFEDLAAKVMRTPKDAIDTHKPIRPRKPKQT